MVYDTKTNKVREFGKNRTYALQLDADGHFYYIVFDIIWYNSENLMKLGYNERRDVLSVFFLCGCVDYVC